MELVSRNFNYLYIYLDIVWLLIVVVGLLLLGRRKALIAGLAGGIIYFIVDWGVFYMTLGTRSVIGADPFWLLLWLSLSYGITNFAWIWLMLDKDKHGVEWTVLLFFSWMAIALISQNFGTNFQTVEISRGTSSYHGIMAVLLIVGYAILAVRNIREKDKRQRANLMVLMAIGIGAQLMWETVLLLSGIRPGGMQTLIINSLIETNLGLPYLYLIHRTVNRKALIFQT